MEHSQPHGSEEFETAQEQAEYGLARCSFHPDIETRLACGKCGVYICPRCMIQTPVGARCRNCAMVRKLPTFDVAPVYYLRASTAGGVVGVVAGIFWGALLWVPFLSWLLAIGTGYAVGESVSVASNRKRGTGLAVIAGLGVALAVLSSLVVSSWSLVGNVFWLLGVLIAFYTAINRVR